MPVRDQIFRDISNERDRQESLFGSQYHSWPVWSAILSEECGEVAEACLKVHWSQVDDLSHLREELIQVAAVATQMIEKLETNDFPESTLRSAIESVKGHD